MAPQAQRFRKLDGYGVTPAPSGAGAILLHSEDGFDCLLVLLVTPESGGASTPAIVTAVGCLQSIFGYPNDEAYRHDPRGDGQHPGCGFYEILDSSWPGRLTDYNRRAFPHAPPYQGRHFFIGCHDACAQLLARELRVEILDGDFQAALSEAVRRTTQ